MACMRSHRETEMGAVGEGATGFVSFACDGFALADYKYGVHVDPWPARFDVGG